MTFEESVLVFIFQVLNSKKLNSVSSHFF